MFAVAEASVRHAPKELSFGASLFMDYMKRALELAALGRGRTSPNPMVGAVIVKDGRIVGEGYHQKAGGPHAEIFALAAAGDQARGATLYVSLEPCCHYGRTPPCTQAIIAAGIAEVHAAVLDPNPLVSGKGLQELQQAGIRTFVGEHEREARELNEVFFTYITRRRPFVIVKYAMSLDGKIATRTGASRGLTGPDWQRELHALRSQVDAILVGVNTVLNDDPLLTVRLSDPDANARQPLRIVLDSSLRTPAGARLLDSDMPGKTLIVTTGKADPRKVAMLQERGAEALVMDGEHIDLNTLLQELARREITSLLVEGGGQVIASFIEARLVDKVIAVIAPLLIGGSGAPTPVEGQGVEALNDALRLQRVDVRRVGEETVITGYVNA